MPKAAWKPWHEVVKLRDDVKSGELSLSIFAADLYDVIMNRGPEVYRSPKEFFSLTFPTYNLRELAKDVVLRLAGKSDKAVRHLELTYGGGKTHSLITLFHLVSEPEKLPDLPAVKEFTTHVGVKPPKARVAVLAFDKLDVEKGMEIRSPKGEARWLKQPWSVLAWQLAGAEGLKILHADSKDEERESAPAENLIADLLAAASKKDHAILILIDEVLMYAHEKVAKDAAWRGRLKNFFQALTQAASKARSCAIVASLLASDPRMNDALGKEISQELLTVFKRESEQGVLPVQKEDVAELLRRRFFKPESIRDRAAFRSHVVASLKGISDLDEQTRKDGKDAEERYLTSFPFHPDLTEVLYVKWTDLEGFQRTRGVLRTFAMALRDAEKWDESSLVGPSVFLNAPGKDGIADAARELAGVAAMDQFEGRRQAWPEILTGELSKAQEIQKESAGLKSREVEQAVVATFLHSQPIGKKASLRELLVLLGPSRPDRIELEKGLRRWAETSWYLDEGSVTDAAGQVPKVWRLGSKPNLKQMHHDAMLRVDANLVETALIDAVSKTKSLTAGVSGAGAKPHSLPVKPSEIEDDGELRFAVLGPKAASESGKPSPEAERFINETTGPKNPRVYRNSVVLVVPSRDGLDVVRRRIREQIGWEEVRNQIKDQPADPLRDQTLSSAVETAKKRVPDAVRQAWCIVVSVSDKNEIHAFKIPPEGDQLFIQVAKDERSRIKDLAISADALLPDGPYNLWKEGQTARRFKDLVGMFAQFPHLPKMLNRKAILDTLVEGCKVGLFVLRARRADGSLRVFWRQEPGEADLKDPSLEVVLPVAAELTELPTTLLLPGGGLGKIWDKGSLTFKELVATFDGKHSVKVRVGDYEEAVLIPKATREVLETAVTQAVKEGQLWLTNGRSSLLAEEIPAGILNDAAALQAPPLALPARQALPEETASAWSGGETTALSLATAWSQKAGKDYPWSVVKKAIEGALIARLVELAAESGPFPCDWPGAGQVKLRLPKQKAPEAPTPPPPGVKVATKELSIAEVQALGEQIAAIKKAAAGQDLKITVRLELSKASTAAIAKVNEGLKKVSDGLQFE